MKINALQIHCVPSYNGTIDRLVGAAFEHQGNYEEKIELLNPLRFILRLAHRVLLAGAVNSIPNLL